MNDFTFYRYLALSLNFQPSNVMFTCFGHVEELNRKDIRSVSQKTFIPGWMFFFVPTYSAVQFVFQLSYFRCWRSWGISQNENSVTKGNRSSRDERFLLFSGVSLFLVGQICIFFYTTLIYWARPIFLCWKGVQVQVSQHNRLVCFIKVSCADRHANVFFLY